MREGFFLGLLIINTIGFHYWLTTGSGWNGVIAMMLTLVGTVLNAVLMTAAQKGERKSLGDMP